jgi:hypothetical protein
VGGDAPRVHRAPDFVFTVDGKKLTVGELKAGMKSPLLSRELRDQPYLLSPPGPPLVNQGV